MTTQLSTHLHSDYVYIGRTYCLALPSDERYIYMNGLVHPNFPRRDLGDDLSGYHRDFTEDAYLSMSEIIGDVHFYREEDAFVRLIYGDVYYKPSTHQTFVLPKMRPIYRIQRTAREMRMKEWRQFKCRTHPLSRYFYMWKGRYPTYEEYSMILTKIHV